MNESEIDPPDGGYGWVILVAVSYTYFTTMGAVASTGLVLVEFEEYFEVSTTYVSIIGSISLGMVLFVAPVVAVFIKRFGAGPSGYFGALCGVSGAIISSRVQSFGYLFFTYGVLVGIAGGCLYVTADIVLNQYFSKRRAFANGVAVTLSSTGIFVWPLLVRFLIDTYGWRGALLITGGINSNLVPAVMLMKPVPRKSKIFPDNQKNYNTMTNEVQNIAKDQSAQTADIANKKKEIYTITKTSPSINNEQTSQNNKERTNKEITIYLWIFLSWICIRSGETVVAVTTPFRADRLDFSKQQASVLLSLYGAAQALSSAPWGVAGDKNWCSKTAYVTLGSALCGVSMCLSLVYSSYWVMIIAYLCFGVSSAAYNAMASVSAVEILGIENVENGIATLFCGYGFGNIVSPFLAGYMYEELGAFWPVLVFGLVQIFGGFLLLCPYFRGKKQNVS